MHFRLVRSVKRKGTINQQFNQRIPADVRDRAIGATLHIPVGSQIVRKTVTARDHAIRVSLRASTPSETKMRQAQVAGYLETVWQGLREPPLVLSHRQAVALSRDVYAWGSLAEIDPELADAESALTGETGSGVYKNAMARLETDLSGPDPAKATAHQILIRRGLPNVAPESVELLAREVLRSLKDGFAQGDRETAGDYTPDPKASRFPPLEIAKPTITAKPDAEVSLTGLVEDWWQEAKGAGRAVSTYESYKGTMSRFVAFLKHDDAPAVTPDDVVRFKDHRLAEGVSPKTVGDSDVAGLRAVFKWAVGNKKLPINPALGIQVVRKKALKLREKDFTAQEAKRVLAHSLNHEGRREAPKLKAAKRWVPWLCAYTGARVGEIVQLRKEDIRQVAAGNASESRLWVMRITPEAGTVKDKEVREVVLHGHLIAQGFLAFVASTPPGYIFLTPRKKDGAVRGVWQSVKNRLREFVREVLTDERVQPNHAWRHTFKTIGREAGIADSVLDAICGHAAKTVGGAYGSVTLKAQRDAMEKFPKFNTEPEGDSREVSKDSGGTK